MGTPKKLQISEGRFQISIQSDSNPISNLNSNLNSNLKSAL